MIGCVVRTPDRITTMDTMGM